MRQELATMREERNHPIRTALARAIVSLENKIDQTRAALETLKNHIVSGCKQALVAFKRGGRDALNNIARFFRLKPYFQNVSKSLGSLIKANDQTVARIEVISAEYHTAGLHVKNIARVLAGKEPLQEIKPNGRLAKLVEAPFKTVRRLRAGVKGDIDRAIASLERLEKEASVRERKPSVLGDIKKYRAMAEQAGREVPERTRAAKQHDAAI
jgi:hypothetical protein